MFKNGIKFSEIVHFDDNADSWYEMGWWRGEVREALRSDAFYL